LKYGISLSLALFLIWLLLSGHYTVFITSLGVVSVLLVVGVIRRMGLLGEETVPLRLTPRFQFYLPWIVWQIAKANLSVLRCILSPGPPIQPCVIYTEATQESELGQVIYANSITLTPGTVSIDIRPGEITVHALTQAAADDVRSGQMNRRVRAIEGR
jgi:multicomponent Na+:H+ antiporter subunit E